MSRSATLAISLFAGALIGGPALAETPAVTNSLTEATEGAVEPATAQGDPLVFTMLVDTKHLTGEFTPIGDVPGGTFRITESIREPETGVISATYVLDPAPKGGDTLTIRTVGRNLGEFPMSDAEYGRTEWSVTEAGSEYEPLVGSHGLAFPIQDVTWRVVTLLAQDWGADTQAT